jgi:hypothetical protein
MVERSGRKVRLEKAQHFTSRWHNYKQGYMATKKILKENKKQKITKELASTKDE